MWALSSSHSLAARIPSSRIRCHKAARRSGVCRADHWPSCSPSFNRGNQVTTFVTADGLVTLSDTQGLTSSRQVPVDLFPRPWTPPLPSLSEQSICLAATFLLAASNGRDGGSRKVQVLGFCRSIDLLSEAVEDAVLRCGGEIYKRDASLQPGCLEERLEMRVALPYLWGVPPAYDALSNAILAGGGVVHKVSKHWQLLSRVGS